MLFLFFRRRRFWYQNCLPVGLRWHKEGVFTEQTCAHREHHARMQRNRPLRKRAHREKDLAPKRQLHQWIQPTLAFGDQELTRLLSLSQDTFCECSTVRSVPRSTGPSRESGDTNVVFIAKWAPPCSVRPSATTSNLRVRQQVHVPDHTSVHTLAPASLHTLTAAPSSGNLLLPRTPDVAHADRWWPRASSGRPHWQERAETGRGRWRRRKRSTLKGWASNCVNQRKRERTRLRPHQGPL